MGFFANLFKKKKVKPVQTVCDVPSDNPECIKLKEIKEYMAFLLGDNRYIPRSEYVDKLKDGKNTVEYFTVLDNSGMLRNFCENNRVSVSDVEETLARYRGFESLIDKHNDDFVQRAMTEEKEYLDNILREVDPRIALDDDQRRVVLTDEDRCLVIAGAGAGKTTTVAAKVKYLVEKKQVDPSQILVVSFTNKAVQELRDKLNTDLKIACPIATFHST